MRTIARLTLPLVLILGSAGLATACGSSSASETVDSVKDEAADEVGEAGARAAGEAFRVSLKGDDAVNDEGVRAVSVLKDNSNDLPGDPVVSGIEDKDGDGLDDDGKVEVSVSDKVACVTLPETGTEIDVTDGNC